MLMSRAKVACCCLLMANGLTAAELLCADSRTQAAESLQLCSSRILEWMERFQGATRHVSPAARACQVKRVVIMYRRACGLLLSCLAVLVLNGKWSTFFVTWVLLLSVITNPSIHTFTKAHMRAVP